MDSATSWDKFFRRCLKLEESERVKIAKLLKQDPAQAIRHPKYFCAQVFAILRFVEGYREELPKSIREVAERVNAILWKP